MTEENMALAKRLVACKVWRWMPGMATVQGERVVLMDDDGTLRLAAPWGETVGVTAVRSFFDSSGACLPDLTDPATLGCILALVRELHQQSSLSPIKIGRDRWCLADYGTTALDGDTEAALLVAALEAAA